MDDGVARYPGARPVRGVVPLLLLSGVVVLVTWGLAEGLWLANVHNALLALAFTGVGTYVLRQSPGHREGLLFVATGILEAVMFLGRQVGHSGPDVAAWWGWLGVWPLALALASTTLSVVGFPDGRLPSRRWRWVVAVVVALAVLCATVSALWPVEYAAAGLTPRPPFHLDGYAGASSLWSHLAHPAYAGFQVLWVVAVVSRWRRAAQGHVRQQLALVLAAAAVSAIALVVGLAGWDSPRAGLLTAALVPLAAGWAIVHGQHVAAYSALSWLSRSGPGAGDLPTRVARAVGDALSAPATLWMGDEDRLLAVGVWPETDAELPATTLAALSGSAGLQVRPVCRDGLTLGALSVVRTAGDALSLAQHQLFADLAAQATLVIENVSLSDLVARQSLDGHLDGLTARERDVLRLMASGRSNAAICAELHLSIKTVEPVVSAIFTKLGLHADSASNRRVLAVLAYLQGRPSEVGPRP